VVQQVNGLLPGLGLVNAIAKVDGDARHNTGLGAGPLALDRPMNVTAEQACDLRVTADNVGERNGLRGPAVAADIVVADVEGWMVNKQERRPLRLVVERRVEPGLPCRAKDTLALAREGRVDGDQAQGMVL
jgi:hypothetical protein